MDHDDPTDSRCSSPLVASRADDWLGAYRHRIRALGYGMKYARVSLTHLGASARDS